MNVNAISRRIAKWTAVAGIAVGMMGGCRSQEIREFDCKTRRVSDPDECAALIKLGKDNPIDLSSVYIHTLDESPNGPVVFLNLNFNPVRDLSAVAGLKKLRHFTAEYSPISDLRPLSGLTDLEDLNLEGTKVKDIGPLSGLRNLEVLSLKNTRVNDVRPLSRLNNLATLYLQETQVSDIFPLSGLRNLEYLGMNASSLLPDNIAALSQMACLKRVDLFSPNFRSTDVTELKVQKPGLKVVVSYDNGLGY